MLKKIAEHDFRIMRVISQTDVARLNRHIKRQPETGNKIDEANAQHSKKSNHYIVTVQRMDNAENRNRKIAAGNSNVANVERQPENKTEERSKAEKKAQR